MMDRKKWAKWVMHTATSLEDLGKIVEDTGIERIDREHSRLVEYIIEMGDSFKHSVLTEFDSVKFERQNQLFHRLIKAMNEHFKTEEYFINKYNLDGKILQEEEHIKILRNFGKIVTDFRAGILSSFQNIRIDMILELVEHINEVDRQTFLLNNFKPVLKSSQKWEDVSEIIKTTGVPFVDKEHKVLTEMIIDFKKYMSQIENRIRKKSEKEIVLKLLNNVNIYSIMHFRNEEEFLTSYKLSPENQSREHSKFLTVINNTIIKVTKNHIPDFTDFVEYLLSWWINHINGTDYNEFHFVKIAGAVFSKSEKKDDFSWLIRKSGIDAVDKEHANLIGLLLKLNKKKDISEKLDLKYELSQIADYARLHFSHEEKLMAEMGIKGIDIHAETHKKVLSYVNDAVNHAISGRSQISPSFLKRMMRWWIEHTNGMDYDTFVLKKKLI